ncbi:hypothetical protein KY321_03460 [Candidatus Woesearchaeota archaeon]|nr:hypothetical protein [Candidatus Woesearchaeota archaeon]
MRRKLIKQGKGALTVSLPKEWVDFNKLKSGHEVDILDVDNTLMVNSDSVNIVNETSISLKKQTPGAFRSLIGSLYRGGYDVIHVEFSDAKVIPNLQRAVDSLYGFEIFDIKEESCVIKSIYDGESTDIVSHIKRIIYTIKMIQGIVYDDIKNKSFNSKEEILQFRNNILKQRDLILRIIKEKKLLDNKHFPYYNVVISLWQVTRFYYYLYTGLNSKLKFDEFDLDLLEKVEKYFKKSFDKFTNLKSSDFVKRNDVYQKVKNESLDFLKEQRCNPLISSFCSNIVFSIQFADSSIYLLNHE